MRRAIGAGATIRAGLEFTSKGARSSRNEPFRISADQLPPTNHRTQEQPGYDHQQHKEMRNSSGPRFMASM
jgi:hypothetical protein